MKDFDDDTEAVNITGCQCYDLLPIVVVHHAFRYKCYLI